MIFLLFILVIGGAVLWAMSGTIRAPDRERGSGDDLGLVGATGEAQETFTEDGKVLVRGELWKASSPRGIIEKGAKIRVTGYKGALTLSVEPVE